MSMGDLAGIAEGRAWKVVGGVLAEVNRGLAPLPPPTMRQCGGAGNDLRSVWKISKLRNHARLRNRSISQRPAGPGGEAAR